MPISLPFNKTDLANSFRNSWQEWIGNLFLIQPYLNARFYVVVYWSLFVEVIFYCLVACLLILYKRLDSRIVTFTALIIGAISPFVMFDPSNPQLAPFAYWSEFLCGALVFRALFYKSLNKIKQLNLTLLMLPVLGLLSLIVNLKFGYNTTLWFASCFAMIIYLLSTYDEKIDQIKLLHWLKYVGLMSYSLYLIHICFLGKVMHIGLRFIPVSSIVILPLQILGWSLSLVASYFFYSLVEKRLNKWRYSKK